MKIKTLKTDYTVSDGVPFFCGPVEGRFFFFDKIVTKAGNTVHRFICYDLEKEEIIWKRNEKFKELCIIDGELYSGTRTNWCRRNMDTGAVEKTYKCNGWSFGHIHSFYHNGRAYNSVGEFFDLQSEEKGWLCSFFDRSLTKERKGLLYYGENYVLYKDYNGYFGRYNLSENKTEFLVGNDRYVFLVAVNDKYFAIWDESRKGEGNFLLIYDHNGKLCYEEEFDAAKNALGGYFFDNKLLFTMNEKIHNFYCICPIEGALWRTENPRGFVGECRYSGKYIGANEQGKSHILHIFDKQNYEKLATKALTRRQRGKLFHASGDYFFLTDETREGDKLIIAKVEE